MNRMEALETVAEAARDFVQVGNTNDRFRRLHRAIAALDALPADPDPAPAEVVEAVMWEAKDGYIELSRPGSPASQRSSVWTRRGTTRLPLVKGDGA